MLSRCGVNENYRCVYKGTSNKQCEYTATFRPLQRFVMNVFASLEGEHNISSVFFYICNNLKVRSKTDSGSPYSDRRKNFWQLMLPSRDA